MQINGPSHIHGAQSLSGPHRSQGISPQKTPPSLHGADQIDISAEAEMVSRMGDLPDIRADKVAEIRAQIDAGVYETDAKLDLCRRTVTG